MIYHRASGEPKATLWLRRRDAKELTDFKLVRVGTEPRLFDSVQEAIDYGKGRDPGMYDAYEIIMWTPQFYQAGSIGAPPTQKRAPMPHRIEA